MFLVCVCVCVFVCLELILILKFDVVLVHVHFILTIKVLLKLTGFITRETITLIDLIMVCLTMLSVAKITVFLRTV